MNTHADKIQKDKSRSAANKASQKRVGKEASFKFVDNRHEAIVQRKLQKLADNRPQGEQTAKMQGMIEKNASQIKQQIQKKENNIGLPDNLKSGIENISGYSMDDVKVHYNSDKPKRLQGHSYAQGSNIHLGAGQEKHLPHEAWHVVQQKKGQVKPTFQMEGGVNINDDKSLENEATIMGAKANASGGNLPDRQLKANQINAGNTVQRITEEERKNLEKKLAKGPQKRIKKSTKRGERSSAFVQEQSERGPIGRILAGAKQAITPEFLGGVNRQDRKKGKPRIEKVKKAQTQQDEYLHEAAKKKDSAAKLTGASTITGYAANLLSKVPGVGIVSDVAKASLQGLASQKRGQAADKLREGESDETVPWDVRMTAGADAPLQESKRDKQKLESIKSAAGAAGGIADTIVPGAKKATSIATKVATYGIGKKIKKDLKTKRADFTVAAERSKTGGRSRDHRNEREFNIVGKDLKKFQKKHKKKRKEI
jgi:hypothetical protein